MTRYYHASSVLTLLVLFISVSFLRLSTPNPLRTLSEADNLYRDTPYVSPESENLKRRQEQRQTIPKEQNEEEEELFKDVDPKTLAAVLLEALNQSYLLQERGRDEEEHNGVEEIIKPEREKEKVEKEEVYGERTARDRDGWQELEMLIASQGKERERDEEEQRKKALEDEEKMTEKVTSHTTSHTIQIQTESQPSSSDGRAGNDAASQQGPSNPEQNSNEDEEQLNSEELKSLETVMKEFPRLNAKRGDDSEQKQRESRTFSSYNDIIPTQKGNDLALTKKKLKWQEETQKALYFPTFAEDNNIYESMVSKAMQSTSPAEQGGMVDDGSDEEKEEEVLSPEEEEAQAKVEQEEIMRQAAEAQKAKLEEEKLADIASDMLLRYMVKQNNGNKKYSSPLSNAAEDKRSNEEQEVTEEDDIDPQTIDKLIEISSKLHLPADDVVDIITDVEKKKKKDMQSEMGSVWHSRPSPLSSSFRSGWQVSNNQNSFSVSKQPSPPVNLIKTWFQEKNLPKSEGLQRKLSKPLQAYHSFWPEKSLSFKQDRWLKSPKFLWRVYPYSPYAYSSYYHRKPFMDYYPFYFTPLPRSKPYYYRPRPALTFDSFHGNSVDDTFTFPPKRRYYSWVQPQLRKPPSHRQQKYYFSNYQPQTRPQPVQQAPFSQVRTPSQTVVVPSQQNEIFTPTVSKNKEYSEMGKQPDGSIHADLEKFIQQVLMNRLQRMD
ncbi:neurosecretory protein VGF [Kryptolebias marmoratus]|uniref:neurosecretory protein VGF n=1 Tax=Kryptolebias marmoratus TaxID=37003 RepID=UPI0007F8797B|nr:neurosecretory protein VGF [Kryptolebias marmoratus]